MKRCVVALGASLLVGGCSNSALEIGGTGGVSEVEELVKTEQLLGSRLQQTFGREARLQRVFEKGDTMMVGVALAPLPSDSDDVPALAVAQFDQNSGALSVIAADPEFREARTLPNGAVALVTETGELRTTDASGAHHVLAQNVRGDLQPVGNTGRLALTLRGELEDDAETAIALTNEDGTLSVLADGAGIDDRPAVSPDGKTVVFVSGRTGIASLWRTTLEGAEPVQLTNAHIEVGVERDGDPEGFVPPPMRVDRLEWVNADVVRYDAGDGEYWEVNVRTGEGHKAGGAR